MPPPVDISVGAHLSLEEVLAAATGEVRVGVDETARARVEAARALVEHHAHGPDDAPVYGVNTGFGALADIRIERGRLRELQINLIRSHACGVGPPLPDEAVRIMLLLRANVLAQGHSGVRVELVETLCRMLERGVHPVIPSRGSVGASGDLAPLAHLALVLVGEGEARFQGRLMTGGEALAAAGIEPIRLEAKEGLALVNGTQAMTAVGILAHARARALAAYANVAGAWSLEALLGSPVAFDPRIHALRPHPGQAWSATLLASLLADSEIVRSHAECGKVQDPYSLRCMPQVHGAFKDAVDHVGEVLEREVNSVTDNPLVFPEEGDVISGGNFHGMPVALVLDNLGTALTALMSMSERRVEQLVNPHLSSGLPAFLAEETGLNSGFMIAQVVAASLVTEAKVLAHPASVDSIPSSANREDHVSMGMTAALKALQIAEHAERVLAVETLCAAQGVDLRKPARPNDKLNAIHEAFRERVPHISEDTILAPLIEAATEWVGSAEWAEILGE